MSTDDQQQQLQTIAYQSWLSRGCPIGSPEVDWDHACKVVSIRLTVIDKAESQHPRQHSTFDELGSEEDTPSDPESVSPFAAAARSQSNEAHNLAQGSSAGKTKGRKQKRENPSTSSG